MLEICHLNKKSYGAAAAPSINNVFRDTKEEKQTQQSMSDGDFMARNA